MANYKITIYCYGDKKEGASKAPLLHHMVMDCCPEEYLEEYSDVIAMEKYLDEALEESNPEANRMDECVKTFLLIEKIQMGLIA